MTLPCMATVTIPSGVSTSACIPCTFHSFRTWLLSSTVTISRFYNGWIIRVLVWTGVYLHHVEDAPADCETGHDKLEDRDDEE